MQLLNQLLKSLKPGKELNNDFSSHLYNYFRLIINRTENKI